MQRTFEKIIERLRKLPNVEADYYFARFNDVIDRECAIEIVSEIAEEYGGGWIPVSSGKLPEVTKLYLVTKMCENDGSPIYDTCHEVFWTKDKKWDCERDEYCEWKVTAWRERLEPYKESEE